MGYGIRDGDIIATNNEKFGALVHSVPVHNYDAGEFSPVAMWETQPAVRTVIDFVTESISLVPFDVYHRAEDGGRTKVRDHPVQHALKHPGYKRGQRRWVQQLQHDMHLYGRWAFTTYPREDGTLEFIVIPAHMFSIAVDGLGRYTDLVIYLDKGQKRTRPLDDVTFDLNVERWHKGHRKGSSAVSTLEGLARETNLLNTYRSDLFRNSAMVPAVIERPTDAGRWSDEAWARFKTQFSSYRPGGGSAGGVPILEDGMTYKPVESVSPRDTQYIEVRQLALKEAAQTLRIPPELVGAEKGTHSNILALREQLYVDVLGAGIEFFTDALNVGLADRLGPDHYIEANLDARLRATFTERVKAYQAAGGGPWMTRAEIRARENLPLLDGTDELIVPMNVTQGGLASPLDTGQTNEEGGEDPWKHTPLGTIGRKADTEPPLPKRPRALAARRKLEETVLAAGAEMRAEWIKRYGIEDPQKDSGEKAGDPAAAIELGRTLLPHLKPEDITADVGKMAGKIFPEFKKAMAAASEDLLEELGIRKMWGEWNAETQEMWCYEASKSWGEDIIQNRYQSVLTDAIAEDAENWQKIALEKLGAETRLTQDAQSIGLELESVGRNDAARAAGATTKTWHTTSKNSRETHTALNGATVPINSYFMNGLRWPGDHYGRGPETANCQCVLTYGGVEQEQNQ